MRIAAETSAPQGPDLAAGVPLASVQGGEPLLRHVGGDPVILVRRGPGLMTVGATCTH